MNFEKEDWRTTDLNVNSLWLIDSRAKGGKHSNIYHGNFVPQIPNNMIRRFTNEGDVVLDMFMGSGTTLFECEALSRKFIGFDINDEIVKDVQTKMINSDCNQFRIHEVDVTQTNEAECCINSDLQFFGKKHLDLILSHPPYLDIIKFTNKREDLSNIKDLDAFIEKYILAVQNCWSELKVKGHLALVIGDIYKNGEVIPLGFYLMNAIKKQFNCKLKGIIVKDIVGNRAKIGTEVLWKYRALKNGNFIFKHEYIMVFRKEGENGKNSN